MGRFVKLMYDELEDGSRLSLVAHHTGRALRIEGQDMGPVTGLVSPDGEYEYCYTVMAENFPALIAALGGEPGDDILGLLEERWSGGNAYRLGRVLRESGVAYEFWCWP
jgi:hypothetical protein